MCESRACGTLDFAGRGTRPASEEPICTNPVVSQGTLSLPISTPESAVLFLEGLGGDAAGAGQALNRIGINAPRIRAAYKQQVEAMVTEIARRMKAGEPVENVARWASAERNRIIAQVRALSGHGTQMLYTVRDWKEYGFGGRSWENITRRYQGRGLTGGAMHQHIVDGAMRSNTTVNSGAMRGAKFLKHGGRVVLVVGVAVSAARIWNATEEELPRVIGQEIGGLVGGATGAGLGVGVCLVFGIASGGWGLLACGIVGGLGGGVAGSYAGDKVAEGIYYSDAATPEDLMSEIRIEIPVEQLYARPPAQMCYRQF